MKQFFKSALLVAVAAVTFTACSKDDKNNLDLNSLRGEYTGTFDFKAEPSDLNPDGVTQTGITVAVKVEKGKIILPEFPAATIVTALLGEEGAAGIIPMLGQISYEATMGGPTITEGQLTADLATPKISIPVKAGDVVIMTVDIDITSPDKVVYVESGKKLTFTLKTTKATLSTPQGAGEPFDLVNTLKFTMVKK